MLATSLIKPIFPSSSATFLADRWADRFAKTKPSSSGTMKDTGRLWASADVTLVPDDTSRAAAVPSIQPLLDLWPIANGPEILTSSGAPSGIAKSFSSPLQSVQEDFGTIRFDQTLSQQDTFTTVYTIDDSRAHTPTANPYTFDVVSLRAQVLSLSETHIFSPSVVNKAVFGFSRGAFFFDSDTTVDLAPWIHVGQPVGAVVVGGGTLRTAPPKSPMVEPMRAATCAQYVTSSPPPT